MLTYDRVQHILALTTRSTKDIERHITPHPKQRIATGRMDPNVIS
jgi:hypothetical protein